MHPLYSTVRLVIKTEEWEGNSSGVGRLCLEGGLFKVTYATAMNDILRARASQAWGREKASRFTPSLPDAFHMLQDLAHV